MEEHPASKTEVQLEGDVPNLEAPIPPPVDRPGRIVTRVLALIALAAMLTAFGLSHRVAKLRRQLESASLKQQASTRERNGLKETIAERTRTSANLAKQKAKAEDTIDALVRRSNEQEREIAAAKKDVKAHAQALQQIVQKLGGKERLRLSSDKLTLSELPQAIRGTERIMDTVREVETLRVQIKTIEEQLAKSRDALDRDNEEIAQQLIKIESLKKLNENQKVKVTKLENRINVVQGRCMSPGTASQAQPAPPPQVIGKHDRLPESGFKSGYSMPLSTFSVDVDTASYAIVRQQVKMGSTVEPDSVRIEEMINYFNYDYPQPKEDGPLAVHVEAATCPWDKNHRLVRIGISARQIKKEKRPACNLVFLVDVSGSMDSQNKLPYVKLALEKLVGQLEKRDRIAVVVYAGAAGLVLPSTTGDQKRTIKASLSKLSAGGSTAGGAGIQLAYDIAVKNRIRKGVNRVILCTDGDFNVGVTSRGGLERLIESKKKTGVFLSILGFGMGNYRDDSMEALSNKGNGNYAYIDSPKEAEKVLVSEVSGTLVTVAKDAKIQVNFNKHKVFAYRLVGYENRRLSKEDFNDDEKDAGDVGAGHTVTALYEVVPVGVDDIRVVDVDQDRYSTEPSDSWVPSDEMLTVKLRYKEPEGKVSKLIEVPYVDKGSAIKDAPPDFKFAAAVAGFGMLIRNSKYKGSMTYDRVLKLGAEGKGKDKNGYRAEFLKLIQMAKRQSRALSKASR